MTTLDQHGVTYRFNGFPITDLDDDGESVVVGYVYEPQWAEADLTPDHWNELAEWFAQDLADHEDAGRPVAEPQLVYLLMERNGVEHEHVRGRAIHERRPAYGYVCAMCDVYIVAKDPGDAPFYGGPWDGRWVVTGGAPVWRVPVIPPVALGYTGTDDVLDPGPTIRIAEYRRARDGAYYIDRQTL